MLDLNKSISMKGRISLITGGLGNIGSSIAEALAQLNSDLIIVDHPDMDDSNLKDKLKKYPNVKVYFFKSDFESEQSKKKLVKKIINEFAELSVLINNAAFVGSREIEGWGVSFPNQTTHTWNRALNVNLTSVFELTRDLTPLLSATKKGSIINISSIYGLIGPDWSLYENTSMGNPAAYAASKGAIIQLTKWMATTLGPNIRANSISPGGIERNQPKTFKDKYTLKTPLKRMASEDDICGAILFLASDLSLYVTGQNIIIDGGFSSW
jgi:NAD(P)-dependent dehydrogenase (short-subunit alcohol dehydrogenase family)